MTSPAGQKPLDLGSKFGSAERALAAIRAGSRVYIGTGCAAPRTLLTRLEAMDPAPADLEFVSFLTTSALPQVEGASRTHYRHRAFFVGSEMRGLAGSGQLDYVPISLEEVPRLLTSGRLPIDVALLQVSPPDARGFVSLGVSVDLAPAPPSPPRNLPIAPIFTAEKVSLAVSREKDGKSRINYPGWDDVKVAQLDEVLELRASSQRVEGWIYPLPGGGLTPLKNEDPPPDPPRFSPAKTVHFRPRFWLRVMRNGPPSVMRNGPRRSTYSSSGPAVRTCLISNEVSRW